jgi:type IV pilus assembly protein PilN
MARINLLPWREERRKVRQNEFYAMLGAAAIAGLLVFGGIWYNYKLQIDGQLDRNAYLGEQIRLLDDKIKKIEELDRRRGQLIARKNVIEQLQANRVQPVAIFAPHPRLGVSRPTQVEKLSLITRKYLGAQSAEFLREGVLSCPRLTASIPQ